MNIHPVRAESILAEIQTWPNW